MITSSQLMQWEMEIAYKDSIISDLRKEIEALREAAEAAKELLENHEEASGACAMCLSDGRGTHAEQLEYALVKVDEAKRG